MNDIYQAMVNVMREIDPIAKSNRNQAQGFNFRGIDDIYNELNSVMAKYGVFSMPEVLNSTQKEVPTKSGGVMQYECLTIRYVFYTIDGSNVSAVVYGVGSDTGDKAANKAMAIAHKYALLQAFCIPTKEEKDPDAQSHERSQSQPANPQSPQAPTSGAANYIKLISEAQRKRMFAISKGNADICKKVQERHGFSSSKDITSDKYEQIVLDIQAEISLPQQNQSAEPIHAYSDLPF
jgi:hypothetical protein